MAAVLNAAGKGGVHVALIERLLKDIGYAHTSSLVRDLVSGFDLVGAIEVASESVECLVRDFESTTRHVDETAEELADRFAQL